MADQDTSKSQDDNINNINIITDFFELYEENYIHDVLRINDNIGLQDISHSQWVAYLDYLCKNYIKPNLDLYIQFDRLKPILNINVVSELFNIYINACYRYNKRITSSHFSMLLGLWPSVFNSWLQENRLNQVCKVLVKTLQELDQESVTELLLDSKGNPTGKIAYLNHKHGWATNSQAPAAVQVNINPELIGARYGGASLTDSQKD